MMPKTRVSPAASRNNSSPNCIPFRHCSMNRSMTWKSWPKSDISDFGWGGELGRACGASSPFHRALVVELVLAVLDDGGNGLEREIAAGVLDHLLQIEILDRKMVVAVLVGATHRCIVRLAHF